jgi:hypothetical protein
MFLDMLLTASVQTPAFMFLDMLLTASAQTPTLMFLVDEVHTSPSYSPFGYFKFFLIYRLGHGNIEHVMYPPCKIETLHMLQIKVLSVSCGAKHTVALTQQGVRNILQFFLLFKLPDTLRPFFNKLDSNGKDLRSCQVIKEGSNFTCLQDERSSFKYPL